MKYHPGRKNNTKLYPQQIPWNYDKKTPDKTHLLTFSVNFVNALKFEKDCRNVYQ